MEKAWKRTSHSGCGLASANIKPTLTCPHLRDHSPRPSSIAPEQARFPLTSSLPTRASHGRGSSQRADPAPTPVNPLPPVDLTSLHFHLSICQTQFALIIEKTKRADGGDVSWIKVGSSRSFEHSRFSRRKSVSRRSILTSEPLGTRRGEYRGQEGSQVNWASPELTKGSTSTLLREP